LWFAFATTLTLLGASRSLAEAAETTRGSASQSLLERILYTIPVGDDSIRSIRLPERECCSDPDAGIGAVASSGAIWWYDLGNRNMKVFDGVGSRVVRGFSGRGIPVDMAVNSSSVYLLFDLGLDPARFLVYAQTHPDTAWRSVPFFYGPSGLPPDSIPVTVRNSSGGDVGQLYAGPDETIYFYQRLAHESYPIAVGDSIFSLADQVRLGFEGIPGADRTRYLSYGNALYVTSEDGEIEYPIIGQLIGIDGAGRIYVERYDREGATLEVRTRASLLVAGNRPQRSNWGGSGAKGSLYILPSGGLLEFQPTAQQLVISVWELPDEVRSMHDSASGSE
jgi:hypothetical protein